MNKGNSIYLQNLFYVHDRKKNLVSISEMEVKGFKVAFINGKVRVKKKIEFSKMLFLMGSGLAICIMLQDDPLGIMSIDISHL